MKYYIIAGEASGDLHGANLIRAICRLDSSATIRYWGGDEMEKACLESCRDNQHFRVRHIKDLAYMGFVEVVLHLHTVLGNIRLCKGDLLDFRPDAVIYIDYPGFNLKIAKFAHQHGLKNYHYISPQLWAWKKGRIHSMKKNLDRLFYILPFEQQFYAKNDFPQAVFVGHPLLDAVEKFSNDSSKPQFDTNRPIIALLPGSRKQELRKTLPMMVDLAAKHPEYSFVIAGMTLIGKPFYDSLLSKNNATGNVDIVFDQTYALLSQSFAAVVCSGTATLETALFNVPQVVCYRANALSIAIARKFVGKRVKYISLVNLIADSPIVKELIQNDMTPQSLESEFNKITSIGAPRQHILDGYATVRQLLGNSGASERVASNIINNA